MAGRRTIRVPRGVTRPTTDFVRQAVFSRLGSKVEGARVADLFAGSGAMGLEALSRGAASCEFVEVNHAAATVVRDNLVKCGLDGGSVSTADAHQWLKRFGGGLDLVFADPPYAKSRLDRDHVRELLESERAAAILAEDGLWVVEQSSDWPTQAASGLECIDRREYGGSAILLYAREGVFRDR